MRGVSQNASVDLSQSLLLQLHLNLLLRLRILPPLPLLKDTTVTDDTLHDLTSVNTHPLVGLDLLEEPGRLDGFVGVAFDVGEEGGGAVVDCGGWVGQRGEELEGWGEGGTEDDLVDVLGFWLARVHDIWSGVAYSALENAETTLKHVHDGIVQALKVVDSLVVVHTSNDERLPSTLGLVSIFPLAASCRFLNLPLNNQLQEFDMPAAEKVEASINIDNLPSLRSLALNNLLHALALRPVPNLATNAPDSVLITRKSLKMFQLLLIPRLSRLQMMLPGAKQHPPHQIRRRNPPRPLHNLEPPHILDNLITIISLRVRRDIISMNNIFTSIEVKPFWGGGVWRIGDDKVGPFAGLHGEDALGEGHYCRTFVFEDGFVGVDAGDEVLAQEFGLEDGICVAWEC